MNGIVQVNHLQKSFGSTIAIDDVSFAVAPGTVTVIIGPSGSGKTTILRTLNALELADSGSVTIANVTFDFGLRHRAHEIAALRRRSAMVFQAHNLFANKTALENVTEGPIHAQKIPASVARADAQRLLEAVGLGGKFEAYPQQLSGGQQQRVGIARALALKPEVLLIDEPTSALDPELVGEVLATLRSLAEAGWTMILVTHAMRFAQQIADDVIFVDLGRIVEQGPPAQVIAAPQHARTRAFLRTLSID